MTLIDARTRARWLFDEQLDGVLPSDAAGNVGDLNKSGSYTLPTVVDGSLTGFARSFTGGSILAGDDDGDALALRRRVAVVALITPGDLSSFAGVAEIVAKGAVVQPFSLRFEVLDSVSRTARVFLRWHTEAGVEVADSGMMFTVPEGEPLLVAGVRDVIDGAFVCRYRVNEATATSSDSHALDVGYTPGDQAWVGGSYVGTIDAIEVLEDAVTDEELQLFWRLMTEDVPETLEALRRLQLGSHSTDPASDVQQEIAVEAGVAAIARNRARRLLDYGLPDKAWGADLERWEALKRIRPLPSADVASRRQAVVDAFQTKRGFKVADVKAQLEEAFGLDSADIEIVEYENGIREDFAEYAHGAIVHAGSGGWSGEATVAIDALQKMTAPAGDYTWTGASGASPYHLWSIPDPASLWMSSHFQLVTWPGSGTHFPALIIGSKVAREWLFVGRGSAGIMWSKYTRDGGMTTPTIITSWGSSDMYMAIRSRGGGNFDVHASSSSHGAAADNLVGTIAGGPTAPQWGGFGFVSDGAITGSLEVWLRDFLIWSPEAPMRFNWYAYRDPALGGTYDLARAKKVVRRIKPTHTHATAIDSPTVQCDTGSFGCDEGPVI